MSCLRLVPTHRSINSEPMKATANEAADLEIGPRYSIEIYVTIVLG